MSKFARIHQSGATALLALALLVSTTVSGDASKVQSLKLEKASGSSSFVISKMGAVQLQEFMMQDPPRLVVDFIGAEHGLSDNRFDGDGRWVERVRSSQFESDPSDITRVVFDLRSDVSYSISDQNDAVTVRFWQKGRPAPSQELVERQAASKPPTPKPIPTMGASNPMGFTDATQQMTEPAPRATTSSAQSQSQAPTSKVDSAKEAPAAEQSVQSSTAQPATPAPVKPSTPQPQWNQGAQAEQPAAKQQDEATALPVWSSSPTDMNNFGGVSSQTTLMPNRNISIDVQAADVQTVLRSISEFSGTNIIAGPDVEGTVTAHLTDVPWRQALDIILRSHGFGWREEYGVVRVASLDRLTKEEIELQEADRRKDLLLPLETRIVPLSFANAQEMRKALKEVLTERGTMEVEAGNNALVITDISKNVHKLNQMVNELDRRIKQVEIVAKMVDVDFEATQEMGIRWDLLNLATTDPTVVADAVIDARAADPTGVFRVGTVQSWGSVSAVIDLLAKDNKANIISNPRIVTANNREASILVGKEIPLIVSDEAGNPITELTKVGIILRCTPHVNSDRTITLDLHPEVSELSSQATVQGGVVISLSEADTRMVVGDGETAVLGGLLNEVESVSQNGVPILMDIPVVGNFFKFKSTTTKKRELIIFVTPRIVDSAMAQR